MAVRDLARLAAPEEGWKLRRCASAHHAARGTVPGELGRDRFERLVDRGFGLTHDEPIDMAPAGR
jgi:hypothetical protein